MKKARPSAESLVVGTLDVHPDGYAFLVRDDRTGPDIFIPERNRNGASHRDLVAVRASVSRSGGPGKSRRSPAAPRLEGTVVEIRNRGSERLVGTLQMEDGVLVVRSDNARHTGLILIPPDGTAGARIGQSVAVHVVQHATGKNLAVGKITRILGARGELATEIDAVLHQHPVPLEMPQDVEAAAEAIAAPTETAATHRDCRDLPLITIDGETAKDFDDAVGAQPLPDGGHRVWVAIADVSYYVAPGSLIDREAAARATSVYLPDRVLPMLPHRLSDDLCSLRPNVDRLALIAEFLVDTAGTISAPQLYRGVIKSRARCTYTQVQRVVDPSKLDPKQLPDALPTEAIPYIHELAIVSERLKKVRSARGSLDFDLPEPEIILDLEGGPEAIVRAPRYFSHQMIEALMIAANEVVATYLTRAGLPCVFRVHPPPAPDALLDLGELLKHLQLHVKLPHPPTPHGINAILRAVAGNPAARLVNHQILRSMAQAVYDTKNMGHFGLASTCYCHFTSPIRRYPDLLVHRLVLHSLKLEQYPVEAIGLAPLQEKARHASRRERVAMEVEREMQKVYRAAFLQQHVGSQFVGTVSHTTTFGFFVEFDEFFVEGLVHRKTLTNDFYQYNARHMAWEGRKRGIRYGIGDRVTVEVVAVNLKERMVDLKVVDSEKAQS